ncbi:MAG: hypothetical protein ACYDAC_09875 [Candidatus Dormibacteria bacterium]
MSEPAKRDSSLRDAFVGVLMTVGPFFGVRYQPPRVEVPVAATPAGDDLDPATAARPVGYTEHADPVHDAPDDGARI